MVCKDQWEDDCEELLELPPLAACSTTLLAAAWAAWPIAEAAECWWLCCCLLLLLYKDRLLSCFSIFLTQVGNVLDQNETYDWAVSGDLIGFDAPAAPLLVGDEELAACATIAALLTIFEAADKALAKFGRDPLDEDGANTAANGDEAAAETTLEAKLEADEPEAVLTGRVCM